MANEPKYVNRANLERLYDNIKQREVQTFDTVAAMQAATYLEAGMTCHTNGTNSANDGLGAYYVIGTSGNIACANNLYASDVPSKEPMWDSPKMLAHRGISTISSWIYAIDNSLWSFMGAIADGFDGFECDVRKDVNDVLVTLHDADVSSVSNSSGDIGTLDYTTVRYATRKKKSDTNTVLTTLEEAAQLVKTFNKFMFVEVKDGSISAQEVTSALISYGLNHDNFGVFRDNDDSWFTAALAVPDASIGYHTANFTATAAEMAALKAMADAAGKPYEQIIVRCQYPQDVSNIKSAGFKSCLEGFGYENSIDYNDVDYSITQRKWNGVDDANNNFKSRSYRIFIQQTANYSTLDAFIQGEISDYTNRFYGRVAGATLTTWMNAAHMTHLNGLSNGAFYEGVTDDAFCNGTFYVFRTNTVIGFSYDKSAQKLYIEPLNTVYQAPITQAILDSMLADVKANSFNKSNYKGYMVANDVLSIFGKSNTSGCMLDIQNWGGLQVVKAVPISASITDTYVYKRTSTTATPTIYTIAGA